MWYSNRYAPIHRVDLMIKFAPYERADTKFRADVKLKVAPLHRADLMIKVAPYERADKNLTIARKLRATLTLMTARANVPKPGGVLKC